MPAGSAGRKWRTRQVKGAYTPPEIICEKAALPPPRSSTKCWQSWSSLKAEATCGGSTGLAQAPEEPLAFSCILSSCAARRAACWSAEIERDVMGNASPKKVYVKPVHTMARRMVSGRWNQSKQPVGLVRFICWLSRCRRRAADLAIAISGVIGSEDVRLCMTELRCREPAI